MWIVPHPLPHLQRERVHAPSNVGHDTGNATIANVGRFEPVQWSSDARQHALIKNQ